MLSAAHACEGCLGGMGCIRFQKIRNFGVSHGPLPAPGVLRIDPSWWLELGSEQPGFASLQVGVV